MILTALLALNLTQSQPTIPPDIKRSSLKSYIYSECVKQFSPAKSAQKARVYGRLIPATARKYKLDPRVVASMITVESHWDPQEVSSAGAIGLMQIMPFHFDSAGISGSNRFDPATNLDLGCKLFAGYKTWVSKRYQGLDQKSLNHRALVAYNMGPGGVSRGIYRSRYSKVILESWDKFLRDQHKGHHPSI